MNSRKAMTSSSPAQWARLVTRPSRGHSARMLEVHLTSATDVELAMLVGCALLLVAVLAVRLSSRAGVPALLVYLGIGLVIGQVADTQLAGYQLTSQLGLVALAVILAEGGLTTSWQQVRGALPVAAV